MAAARIRLPLRKLRLHGSWVYEIPLTLEIRTAQGSFVQVPFVFDTGTHFTTLAISDAKALGIPFTTSTPVPVRGATGPGAQPVYLSALYISFPGLPNWQFVTQGCFTPYPIRRAVLSLADVIVNFAMRSGRPTAKHPDGSLVLQLRKQHQGQPRP
ncbi:MAG: hypothetical protein L0Z62_11970 [Gemmataceae bacterium]|nr:hypothetical protein [Gemmataceae bacterium]